MPMTCSYTIGRTRDDKLWMTVQLAPLVYQPADSCVGNELFVRQWLVGEGRDVVQLHPTLDVLAVVRVAVGSQNRVVHQRAFEHHVLQQLCNKRCERRPVASGGRGTNRGVGIYILYGGI